MERDGKGGEIEWIIGRKGKREEEKKKKGLKLTKDETDRKKGRSWKEGELRRVSMEGLVVAHSGFIINVIVFFLLDNFF